MTAVAGSQLQIEVGDDDDPNGYITAKEIHVIQLKSSMLFKTEPI
jgi:hypothetical protein